MTSNPTRQPFQLPAVPAGEMTPLVQSIMQLLQAFVKENAQLRYEVAVLKGHKSRPNFKGSNLVKKTGKDDDQPGSEPGKASRTQRVLAAELPLHEDRIVQAQAVPSSRATATSWCASWCFGHTTSACAASPGCSRTAPTWWPPGHRSTKACTSAPRFVRTCWTSTTSVMSRSRCSVSSSTKSVSTCRPASLAPCFSATWPSSP